MPHRLQSAIFIGMGCNIGSSGQRRRIIRLALHKIAALPATRVLAVSSLYETPPWGILDQDDFTNAVAAIDSNMTLPDLLHTLKSIELQLGRKVRQRWGPREIDLDILLAGNLQLESARLTVPHPELRNRDFVLIPLREIAPGIRL